VVILPIIHGDESRAEVMEYCESLARALRGHEYDHQPVRVEIDTRDMRGGEKTWQWVKRGVPVRLEIGPRDVAKDAVFYARRDRPPKEKQSVPREEFVAGIATLLQEIQLALHARARDFREAHTRHIDDKDEFIDFFTPRSKDAERPEIHGGFVMAHFCGDPAVEDEINKMLSVTVRCIPLEGPTEPGKCVWTGRPSNRRVVWAKAY
jgi:prolyl-tRNA synthetase